MNRTNRMREGDWICPKCSDHQFARNTECRQCGEARPKGMGNTNIPVRSIKPGDWYCSVCSGHQFASRTECRDCGAPKDSKTSGNKDSVTKRR